MEPPKIQSPLLSVSRLFVGVRPLPASCRTEQADDERGLTHMPLMD